MKFNCDTCGKIDEAKFDGYDFGDRLLEGTMFLATKADDGTCTVRPATSDDDAWLNNLNRKQWLAAAKRFAEENDIFICPQCGGDVVPDDMLC